MQDGKMHKIFAGKTALIVHYAELGPPRLRAARQLYHIPQTFVNRQNAQKKSAPLTAGAGQSDFVFFFIVNEY